jgi:hypothetical protein
MGGNGFRIYLDTKINRSLNILPLEFLKETSFNLEFEMRNSKGGQGDRL